MKESYKNSLEMCIGLTAIECLINIEKLIYEEQCHFTII